jgi:arginine-tRNA-protein transferase
LGSLIVLWLIEAVKREALTHVYLGYWIGESAKMAYKVRFQPLEALTRDGWRPLDTDGVPGPADPGGTCNSPAKAT